MLEDDKIDLDLFEEDYTFVESEEDLEGISKARIRSAMTTGSDWTTETILSQIDKGNIFLNPDFQRRDAWTPKRKSKFIESIILGFPIPQLVLAEMMDVRGRFLILDGKQRLLSLRQFAAKDDDKVYEQLKLRNLEVRNDLNGKSLDDFKSSLELADDLAAFENQTIRTIVIRNWPNDNFLYHVFLRLNTGTVPLSPQELRQALLPGPFVKFVDLKSRESKALRQILKRKKPDFRMRDAELLVRYFAFSIFLPKYAGNLKQFLDKTCETLNQEWEDKEEQVKELLQEFELSHEAIVDVFGEHAYQKWTSNRYETRFNRAVFDIMHSTFRVAEIRESMVQNKEDVIRLFEDLCQEGSKFRNAIEQTTKSIGATSTRLRLWSEGVSNIIDRNIIVPKMTNT